MAMIQDGTEHSAAINAKFAAFQMKTNKLEAMGADNVDVDNVDTTVAAEEKPEVSGNEKAAQELFAQMEATANA